jgi:basic membrane protein A and related proteins
MRLSVLVHIGLCISVCACGEDPGSHTHALRSDRATSDGKSFKVGLLTPGPISDQAWNAAAYRGLLRIQDSLHAEISHVETKTPAEFDENFRQYGAQGFNLVFGNGFEYQDAVQRVALDYPQTIFVTTSGDRTGQNWAGIDFAFEDGAYLAGIIAGNVTKSNVIGTIGGTELPPVKRGFAGFAAGARAVNPKIKVLTSYVGNWDDASAAKEQALAQINAGADVIFQNADAAGLGVFQAAKDSKGVWIVGANSDQNSIAPAVTLGSVVIDLPHALLMIAREVREGLFVPRVVKLGTPQQVVKLVINPALGAQIPAATRLAVDSVQRIMLAGRFSVLLDTAAFASTNPAATDSSKTTPLSSPSVTATGAAPADSALPPRAAAAASAAPADTSAKNAPSAAAAGVH